MKRKVILTCAVTGNAPFNPRHPCFPVTPKEIAASAIEAAKAGASIDICMCVIPKLARVVVM